MKKGKKGSLQYLWLFTNPKSKENFKYAQNPVNSTKLNLNDFK